jgi:hypothetical protein
MAAGIIGMSEFERGLTFKLRRKMESNDNVRLISFDDCTPFRSHYEKVTATFAGNQFELPREVFGKGGYGQVDKVTQKEDTVAVKTPLVKEKSN